MSLGNIPHTDSKSMQQDVGHIGASGRKTKHRSGLDALIFVVGGLLNTYSYGSLAPLAVIFIFYAAAYVPLRLTAFGGVPELRMFNRVFSVGFFAAGIAAIYANQLEDSLQLFSDAGSFFDLATGNLSQISLLELRIVHEGSLGIVIWSTVYDFFATLGFERERHIGIAVNIMAVALSGVVGIKMVRGIYGNDSYRFQRMIVLVSACGLFWLFASVHLRDSIVLLAITLLAYGWQYFLARPDIGWRLALVITLSVLSVLYFGYLRREFMFVPVAMSIAVVAALYFGAGLGRRRLVVYTLMILGAAAVVILTINFSDAILLALDQNNLGYGEKAALSHDSSSLGMSLIVNQSIPVRLILGSLYLFVFPIPFWSGFQLESAYELFKSVNVVFFYFVIPLLYMALRGMVRDRRSRHPTLLFMVFLSLGMTMAVAATSLETRHFGAFLVPLFVFATIPDLRLEGERKRYMVYLTLFLSGVVVVHMAWAAVKIF